MSIHPVNARLKDLILTAPYEICIERARYVTESYRRHEGQAAAMKAAYAFSNTLSQMSVYLLDDELVIGNRSSKLVGSVIPIERGDINTVLDLELDRLTRRERQPYHIDAADRLELQEDILPYWRGKTLRDHKNTLWKANDLVMRPAFNPVSLFRRWRSLDIGRMKDILAVPNPTPRYMMRGLRELFYNNPAFIMNVFDVQGHLIVGHKHVLSKGFSGIEAETAERLVRARRERDSEGIAFCEAVMISCRAVKHFGERLANEAEREARNSSDENRRRELLAMAKRCRKVPYQPPETFHEAVQALWLTQVGALVAHGMPAIFAIGRFDQYLEPFYRQDKAAGRLTDAHALRLLEELLVKLSSNLLLIPFAGKATGNELGADSCVPTIGGVTPEGEDAVNDLSYLILDAYRNVRSMGNSFSIRLSDKTPERFWRKTMATYRETSGAALFYDEKTIGALENCGVSEADARDYGIIGCVEPTSDGNTFGCTSGNDISFNAALEMALHDGVLHIMGRRVGLSTGDPSSFRSFEELFNVFKRQVEFMVDFVARAVNLKDQAYRDHLPCPFVSATLRGCVENGRDMTAGGADYNFSSISARGLGTVVDSLCAIRQAVFEDDYVSLTRLVRAMDHNYSDEEVLQAYLKNRCPVYGSDDNRADVLAQEIVEHFCKTVLAQSTVRGGCFRPGFFSYGMHVLEGLFLGASANGRLAGEPVSNSFSPANGSERNGPTAVMRSVGKNDHTLISNGCALNIKLSPAMFEGEERLDKMVALVKGYFKQGGMELSPNVISSDTLRAAQKDPEAYRDLVVRVSGYSALFADLGKPLQDEIIQRTEFGHL